MMLFEAAVAAAIFGPAVTADTIPLPNTVVLEDRNASMAVGIQPGFGAFEWTIEGVNHLNQQWFWVRTGQDWERPLHTPSGPVAAISSDSNGNGDDDMLFLKYDYDLYTVEVTYLLTGGEALSNTSSVAETIRIISRCEDPLDLHFFQYTDLDLNGTPADDTVEVVNASTVQQYDPLAMFSETVVTPDPDRYEADYWSSTRDKLEDGLPSELNNSGGPLTGDVTWAFQWDFLLDGYGDTFIISKDKLLVGVPIPAPGAMILGLVGLALVRRVARRLT